MWAKVGVQVRVASVTDSSIDAGSGAGVTLLVTVGATDALVPPLGPVADFVNTLTCGTPPARHFQQANGTATSTLVRCTRWAGIWDWQRCCQAKW